MTRAIGIAVVVSAFACQALAEEVRVPVTRDTWVSAVGEEATANLGGAPRLKLKSIQEMTLVDIDPAPLRGRVITKATLHVRLADKERLRRVTVSTVSAEWDEGTSPSYAPGAPGASFRFRKNPDVPWSYPGSDLTSVVLGQGSSFWRMADATDPDADGWQSIPVEPSVVAARVAGLSHGFLVFDDTGSEWTYDGTKYEHRLFPNRFIYSREAGADKAPYFLVELGAKATAAAGREVSAPAQGRPFDRAVAPAKLPPPALEPFRETALQPPVRLGDLGQVFLIDELDVYTATGQKRTGPRPEYYTVANHLWSGRSKQVRLQAARNEFVAFQVLVEGKDPALDRVLATLTFPEARSRSLASEVGRYIEVPTADGSWVGDPIVPLGRDLPFPKVEGRVVRSLHVELYVPHEAPAGTHHGTLRIEAAGGSLELAVALEVSNFTLPDRLTFLPEMNCYDLPENERDYYRLAHRHRTFINRVPYHQDGRIADGCAPAWDGRTLDWSHWDRRFGPLLDGSAFADLPRRGIPIDGFYIPLHENWPTAIVPNYNGNYWADLAFTPGYRAAMVEVSRQFARHLDEKGWNHTLVQAFFNGKNDFKKNGWRRGSSPWLLDEPANFQDYWALRWFGLAIAEGVQSARKSQPAAAAQIVYRADISRPEWQRDALDGLVGYEVVSNDAFRHYGRLIRERKARLGQVVMEYGGANPIGSSNVQAVGWCFDAWARGADGVLPWQTIGTPDSWNRADDLSLFYPGRKAGEPPVASVRLKAFRRGQQDVEYLKALSGSDPATQAALGSTVRSELALQARREETASGGEDAGRLAYDRLDPIGLWTLRVRVAAALETTVKTATPPSAAPLVLPAAAASGDGYVPGHVPQGQSGFVGAAAQTRLAADGPRTGGREIALPLVADVLLDPNRPDQPLGQVGRDNALFKNQKVSAFLLKFDTRPIASSDWAKLVKATLRVRVWDPSSQGRTRLEARWVATPWQPEATWNGPGRGRWKQGAFDPARDAPRSVDSVVVEPDAPGTDTLDPPREVALDVTPAVRFWLDNPELNHGLVLVPVPDKQVDEGHFTRMQIYGSEERTGQHGPTLTVIVKP